MHITAITSSCPLEIQNGGQVLKRIKLPGNFYSKTGVMLGITTPCDSHNFSERLMFVMLFPGHLRRSGAGFP